MFYDRRRLARYHTLLHPQWYNLIFPVSSSLPSNCKACCAYYFPAVFIIQHVPKSVILTDKLRVDRDGTLPAAEASRLRQRECARACKLESDEEGKLVS